MSKLLARRRHMQDDVMFPVTRFCQLFHTVNQPTRLKKKGVVLVKKKGVVMMLRKLALLVMGRHMSLAFAQGKSPTPSLLPSLST